MGKSKSISEQEKSSQEFQQYVEKMNENMDNRQAALGTVLDGMQEEHYKPFSDKALLIEGKYSHLTTVSQWSLQSVSDIIDACAKAIFGSKAPVGSKKEEMGEESAASIQAIKERESYIANAAFDVVQSIVGSFQNSTSTSVERKLDGKPIAPGMTLFIGVENNAFSSQKFFSKEKIVQTIFVFKVYYSLQEGKTQSALSDLQVYEDQKQVFRKKIEILAKMVEELDPLDDAFEEKYTKLVNRSELMNQRLEAISKRIADLLVVQNRRESLATARNMEQIRGARKHLLQHAVSVCQVTGTPFTYVKPDPYDAIMAYVPAYVRISLRRTDYTSTHYEVTAVSDRRITKNEVDSWVRSALKSSGNFHFD